MKKQHFPKIDNVLFAPLSDQQQHSITGGIEVGDTTYQGSGMDRVVFKFKNGTYYAEKIPGHWA